MAFSFFKKDPKDTKKGAGARSKPPASRTTGTTDVATRPMPKPIGRPLDGPSNRSADRRNSTTTSFPITETALPERERVRNQARQTAAKIDAIEAEIARDLAGGSSRAARPAAPTPATPPPGGPATVTGRDAPSTVTGRNSPTTVSVATVNPAAAVDPLEVNSGLGGNVHAIEINTATGSSVIDEAAILFSNGQADAAEAILRDGLQRDDVGSGAQIAWRMLFELANQRGDRAAFEKLTMDYALRFEHSPPAWFDYAAAPTGRPTQSGPATVQPRGGPGVRLPRTIDAGIVGHLEKLRGLTAAHAAVLLDVSDAKTVDIAGASLLLRVITAFKRSQRELTLVGAASFADVLSRAVESGRRDPSDAPWMLLLEVQRMLGRLEEFEETAIQYCITFEVSPPSWEPPPANLKVAPASDAPAPVESAGESLFELRGVVDGDGEPLLGRMVTAARNQPQFVIDCLHLRRLAFSAGSALLGAVQRIRRGGSEVELRNVNALVAALLHLLGVTSIAPVQTRQS